MSGIGKSLLTPSSFQVKLKAYISFHMLAALYQGTIFYQNDIKYVNPDTKSADISL
jgi:hypothetical protein